MRYVRSLFSSSFERTYSFECWKLWKVFKGVDFSQVEGKHLEILELFNKLFVLDCESFYLRFIKD